MIQLPNFVTFNVTNFETITLGACALTSRRPAGACRRPDSWNTDGTRGRRAQPDRPRFTQSIRRAARCRPRSGPSSTSWPRASATHLIGTKGWHFEVGWSCVNRLGGGRESVLIGMQPGAGCARGRMGNGQDEPLRVPPTTTLSRARSARLVSRIRNSLHRILVSKGH